MVLMTEKKASTRHVSPVPILVHLDHYTVFNTTEHGSLWFTGIPVHECCVLAWQDRHDLLKQEVT